MRPVLPLTLILIVAASPLAGQTLPAAIVPAPVILLDTVVTEQWPFTLPKVNLPTSMALLNPGQCIRTAVLVKGTGHETLLAHASLTWTATFRGRQEAFPQAPFAASKQIKPQGTDFVQEALHAGGIQHDPLTFVTLYAATGKYCLPQGAPDGTLVLQASVQNGDHATKLDTASIQIESLATAAKKSISSLEDLEKFCMGYHLSPEPARLLPAFQYLGQNMGESLVPFAFFRAAFLHDAATVQGFGPGLAASPKLTQVLALNLLAKTGVKLTDPPPLTDQDRKAIAEAADLPNPYNMKPNEELFTKLDFLWADFSATGRPQPVQAVVSALAWRSDYEAFDAMRKSGKKPAALTESIVRGVTYTAAGWSLKSFQQTDPLAADYLDAIMANPATPPAIVKELRELGTNPAFKK